MHKGCEGGAKPPSLFFMQFQYQIRTDRIRCKHSSTARLEPRPSLQRACDEED
jgi:hypothetical protein